jgi:uncharacterized protein (DUF2062 family)
LADKRGFRTRFLEMLGRNDPPEMVAASFALGVTISFTPLIGIHWLLALLLAFVLKLNKVDVLLGTLVVNPITIGPISAVALPLGRLLLRAERVAVSHLPWKEFFSPAFWSAAGPRMRAVGLQWGVGMFLLSIISGTLTYVVLLKVIRSRRARLGAVAAVPPGAMPPPGSADDPDDPAAG